MAKKRKKAKRIRKKPKLKKSNGLKNVKIISTKGVAFAELLNRGSKYDVLFAKIGQLKPGQSILLDVPQGVAIQVYHNRINSAWRKNTRKPPKGCTYEKRTTKNGKIAISCVKN